MSLSPLELTAEPFSLVGREQVDRPIRASQHELRAIAEANKTLHRSSPRGEGGAFPRGVRPPTPCWISHVERPPQGRGRPAHATLSSGEAEQYPIRAVSRRSTKMGRLLAFR